MDSAVSKPSVLFCNQLFILISNIRLKSARDLPDCSSLAVLNVYQFVRP